MATVTPKMLHCIASMLLVACILLLAACGGASTPASEPTDDLRTVTMALPYIPNVQFAPYYVADSKGYYAEEGLEVEFDYNFETDVMQRLAAWPDSEVAFAMGSGLSVMLARQQELPVVTVMTLYQEFPVVLFSKSSLELEQPEDLRGRSIGIPGRFGASYYGLQALLYASDIEESELDIQEVGFNQFQLVLEDTVDVATGYAMNEPVKLRQEGWQVDMLRVADYFPLASDGIVTNEALIEQDSAMVRGFVQASLRGLADTLEDPDEAFELSLDYIPEANITSPEFERAVLQESLSYWESDQTGYTEPQVWKQSQTFLLDSDLLNEPVDLEEAYTNQFIE